MQLSDFLEWEIFPMRRLSPRERQVLERMLLGDSEKQIALHLRVSQHTVHVYVKNLYVAYDANSRGELMAKFIPSRLRNFVCRPN